MSETAPVNPRVHSDALATLAQRLRAALAPQAIYLFGSHAHGQPHAGSDIDILIVLADEQFSTWDVAKRGYNAVDGLGLPVELHFTWSERLHERSAAAGSFEQEVVSKGRLLYAA
ncbi:MAG: nucleotidyltransferase domain-containing protein [Phycisphaerales bacterium]|nr:nucleotidyltransferase domain-containing protein [Phycisphaerales bacterium]